MSPPDSNGPTNPQEPYGDKPVLLVTNDDGLNPGGALVLDLAQAMVQMGHRVLVCAPGTNNSACGQKISLGTDMQLRRHPRLEQEYNCGKEEQLLVYSLEEGSPSDCVIVATEPFVGLIARHGLRPLMTLSGVNLGPNLGADILYSGTFAAARQAAMYGIPGLAVSLAEYGNRLKDPVYAKSCERAVEAAAKIASILVSTLPTELPDVGRLRLQETSKIDVNPCMCGDEGIRAAFAAGDVVVNVNVPGQWNGQFESCRLDSILYRSVVKWQSTELPSGESDLDVGRVQIGSGKMHSLESEQSDSAAVKRGRAAVCTVSTWPTTHPLALSQSVLEDPIVNTRDKSGAVPSWMVR